MISVRELLKWGHEALFLTSGSARLDAELLLSYVLKKPVTFLLAHDDSMVGIWSVWKYKRLIHQRKKGVPVAYLIGHKEFFGLDFKVNRHVLIPRPDTEILVECVISYFKSGVRDFILLDIGTGSGCIPIAVCKHVDGLKAIAADISRQALKMAVRNAERYGLCRRIQFIKSDLLNNIDLKKLEGKTVIVTANLPYIPKQFQVSPELHYEPSISLYGGDDGIEVYRRLADQLNPLRPRVIFFELFEEQIAILKTHLPDYRLKYVETMSGKARALVMERVSVQ